MDGREFLAGYKAFADRGHPVPRFCKRRDLNISQYIVIYHVHRKTVRTSAFRLLREGPRGTGGLQGPRAPDSPRAPDARVRDHADARGAESRVLPPEPGRGVPRPAGPPPEGLRREGGGGAAEDVSYPARGPEVPPESRGGGPAVLPEVRGEHRARAGGDDAGDAGHGPAPRVEPPRRDARPSEGAGPALRGPAGAGPPEPGGVGGDGHWGGGGAGRGKTNRLTSSHHVQRTAGKAGTCGGAVPPRDHRGRAEVDWTRPSGV